MRLSKTLAAGAVALTALVTLTGCGDDGGDAAAGPLSGLPQANTMAELQKFITGTGAQCSELRPSDVDGMIDESKDPAWSIKEREVCDDDLILLLIDDMAKFQEATAKAEANGGFGRDFLIGQNFALTAVGDEASQLLMQGGLTRMSCNPGDRESLPTGFTAKDGLAKGCFTTDYMPD
ncbi:hypothetical protein [Streptomyces vilmorinianum]|uniref:hypothetical protein n=1 Tax=Streptomyces vilmorinianum TaxID=3051092 RepID=UPI0010FB5A12|nr:hypothetical protein [Streptomyces vilmorinianum]